MTRATAGIHHITAIASDPQRNVDFYCGVLGLRLVKRTVNFDDPGTYHLYYGDESGRPGTLLTFFPWLGAAPGRAGSGLASAVAFSIPEGATGHWTERLERFEIAFEGPSLRFDETVIVLRDPDGLELDLVAHAGAAAREPWRDGPVGAAHAIRGFHGVTLAETGYERTAALLTGVLGFRREREEGNRVRFAAGAGSGAAGRVDVVCLLDALPGSMGAGTMHHVAWRATDDDDQLGYRRALIAERLDVTPVVDRQYFRSIYFHEPGGVLFEIATDPPGMTVDEPVERLGESLRLPPWLEPDRARIERRLPPITVPGPATTR